LQGGFERVAAYDYTEDGEILYQVLRYEYAREPKQFLVRHPDNNGGWLFGAGGRRVLYRGDDMREAVPTTVFVTEGEKDADRLASLGFTAVTVAFGEGGFRPWLPPRLARFHRGISP
jgi:hypothetical protein